MLNSKEKQSLKALLYLRSQIDSRIDNEISEGVLRGRGDFEKLKESIEYLLEEFPR